VGHKPEQAAKLPLVATIAKAYLQSIRLLPRVVWPFAAAVAATLLLGLLDHSRLAPLWREADVVVPPTQGPGWPGYVYLVPVWGMLFASLALLSYRLQQPAGTDGSNAITMTGAFGLSHYAVKLALCVGLSMFIFVIAVPQAGIATTGLVMFAPYSMAAAAARLPAFDLPLWVYLGLAAAWHTLLVRMLLILPATAAADQYMDFTESWLHTRGNGGRLLLGLLLSGLPLLIGVGLTPYTGSDFIALLIICGAAVLSVTVGQVFLGLSYRHFAAERDRARGSADTTL
jgi:hypothetical protein